MALSSVAPPRTYGNTYSADYEGSSQEWQFNAAREMARRYSNGDQSLLDNLSGATGSIGQPSRSDFGTRDISPQTYDFFANYVSKYGGSDPYLQQQFGDAPGRRASFGNDPNSPSELQKRDSADRAADRESNERIAAGRNATDIATANIAAGASRYASDQQLAGVKLRVDTDWKISVLEDATRRYIAEGDWGTQKYIAELQDRGAMERLRMELGMRDKELAQVAIRDRNQHHEAMVGLALEVAKYDSELAASPRNWMAYAAWLGNRGIVVNGLNLAMAADLVPPEQITPAQVANSQLPGANVAAIQTATVQQQEAQQPAGTQVQPQGAQTPGAQSVMPGLDLNSTDYSGLARRLLAGTPQAPPSVAEMQTVANQAQGFGADRPSSPGTGAVTNQLGVKVNPFGNQRSYKDWFAQPATMQEMDLGSVESVRGRFGVNDFLQEMQRSRPKGVAQGAAALG